MGQDLYWEWSETNLLWNDSRIVDLINQTGAHTCIVSTAAVGLVCLKWLAVFCRAATSRSADRSSPQMNVDLISSNPVRTSPATLTVRRSLRVAVSMHTSAPSTRSSSRSSSGRRSHRQPSGYVPYGVRTSSPGLRIMLIIPLLLSIVFVLLAGVVWWHARSRSTPRKVDRR